jgi:hypothetical protein
MRWLLNLGYLITASVVVGIGMVGSMLFSALMAALGFLTMVGGAIAVAFVLIKELCESKK